MQEREARAAALVRVPLFFGLFGSFGATLGWFVWIAGALFVVAPGKVIIGVLVGSIVGIAGECLRRYREIAGSHETEVTKQARVLLV